MNETDIPRQASALSETQPPKGRLADKVACAISLLAALLAFITASLFFAGFASNDTNPASLASAFILSFGLGVFAIIPALLTAKIAYKSWREGMSVQSGLYALFFSFPWVILSALILSNTPLPTHIGFIALTLSSLICVWTIISLCLIIKNKHS